MNYDFDPHVEGADASAHDPVEPAQPGIAVPMLVSGICNCLYGVSILIASLVFGAFTFGIGCFLIVLAVPLVALAVFEFKGFGRFNAPGPHSMNKSTAMTIGILEICTFLLGNTVSGVCGIIVVVIASKLDQPR